MGSMNVQSYLDQIESETVRSAMESIFAWMKKQYPMLTIRMAWNQPMFVEHDTYIIAFSAAKRHITVGLESVFMDAFKSKIEAAGYVPKRMTFSLDPTQVLPEALLIELIEAIRIQKKDIHTFWMPQG